MPIPFRPMTGTADQRLEAEFQDGIGRTWCIELYPIKNGRYRVCMFGRSDEPPERTAFLREFKAPDQKTACQLAEKHLFAALVARTQFYMDLYRHLKSLRNTPAVQLENAVAPEPVS